VIRCGDAFPTNAQEAFPMESMLIEFPERLAAEMKDFVRTGWFPTESELIRRAVAEFIQQHKPALTEGFQIEDIEWTRQRILATK
jgi:Arc/MetJ-type ribon-helix-helix transcriptional regulator